VGNSGEQPWGNSVSGISEQPVLDLQISCRPESSRGRPAGVPSFHPRAGQAEQRLPWRVGLRAQVPGADSPTSMLSCWSASLSIAA
jgi:hypothetical protein